MRHQLILFTFLVGMMQSVSASEYCSKQTAVSIKTDQNSSLSEKNKAFVKYRTKCKKFARIARASMGELYFNRAFRDKEHLKTEQIQKPYLKKAKKQFKVMNKKRAQ